MVAIEHFQRHPSFVLFSTSLIGFSAAQLLLLDLHLKGSHRLNFLLIDAIRAKQSAFGSIAAFLLQSDYTADEVHTLAGQSPSVAEFGASLVALDEQTKQGIGGEFIMRQGPVVLEAFA